MSMGRWPRIGIPWAGGGVAEVVATYSSDNVTTGSHSVTAQSGDLIVVAAVSPTDDNTISASGSGLTFTSQSENRTGGTARILTAPASGNVTVSLTAGSAAYFRIVVLRGVSVGTSGNNGTWWGDASVTLTLLADSIVVMSTLIGSRSVNLRAGSGTYTSLLNTVYDAGGPHSVVIGYYIGTSSGSTTFGQNDANGKGTTAVTQFNV